MKTLPILVLLACAFVLFLSGCASRGPSPEQQVRELDQQKEAERQQADFRKTLPPVTNPGRDQ
jgi:predicted small lipoprotein YifL